MKQYLELAGLECFIPAYPGLATRKGAQRRNGLPALVAGFPDIQGNHGLLMAIDAQADPPGGLALEL